MSSAALFARRFREACGMFSTGVAVLTTRGANGEAHGITVNSFCSLSLHPPLVMVAIARDCTYLNHFESCAFFAVNILREDQRDLSHRFAHLPDNRFKGIPYRDTASGSPWIDHVLALLDCKTTEILDMGDHRLLIGEVLEVAVTEGRPLIFFRSDYPKLA